MINRVKIVIPTVVYPNESLEHKFEYPTHGTISFNNRDAIPIPLESLLLIREEIRLCQEKTD